MAQSIRRSNTLGTMDHKLQQRDKSRTGYFGNVKNRLGSKLSASGSQPQELSKGLKEPEPRARCATVEAKDGGGPPHHATASGPLHHVHHIRNPKLRQYYLQGNSSELNPAQQEGSKTPPRDTVFSVTSQFDVHCTGDPSTTASSSAVLLQTVKKTPTATGPKLKLQSQLKEDLPEISPSPSPSPSPEAEYDKLLDVEAVPMPDGQLCLLTLPPECCQGEGPEAVPYLKLFCRYITDCKGVVSGILLVTPNKLFFDPCKSLPLVLEHGCEEYLLSVSLDGLASLTVFTDISHVHFSQSQRRWKGKRSTTRAPQPGGGHDPLSSHTTKQEAETGGLAAPSNPPTGQRSGDDSDVGSARKHLESGGPPGPPSDGAALLSAAPSRCGGQDGGGKGKTSGASEETQPRAPESFLRERYASAPGGRPPSVPGGVVFVRLRSQRNQRPLERTSAGARQGTSNAPARKDAWLALSQEGSDQLHAYLSLWCPDICILEGGEEDREAEAHEEEFVLVEEDEDEEEEEAQKGTRVDRHSGEDWEMLSMENSGSKPTLVIDREPECLTDILEASCILEASHIRELCTELPPRTIGHAWQLAYSTSRHGFSLKSLYRKLRGTDSPVLIVIKDALDQVFGSFLSHPLRPSEAFYGTGETFLFMLHPRFKCFRWTGENTFFIKGNLDSFAIGGGSGHFGLWLDETLYLGRSSPCYTFNNCCLSEVDDFHVIALEVWTFS